MHEHSSMENIIARAPHFQLHLRTFNRPIICDPIALSYKTRFHCTTVQYRPMKYQLI